MSRMVMGVEAVLMWAMLVAVQVPDVAATRWTVGGNVGWIPNHDYTSWTDGKKFYNGDSLNFVYDKTSQLNVLEVNKASYEFCNSDIPLHNWTTGYGRDEVPLNENRYYYFISSNDLCHSGMKLAVLVEDRSLSPSSAASLNRGGQMVLPALFVIGALCREIILFGFW